MNSINFPLFRSLVKHDSKILIKQLFPQLSLYLEIWLTETTN